MDSINVRHTFNVFCADIISFANDANNKLALKISLAKLAVYKQE